MVCLNLLASWILLKVPLMALPLTLHPSQDPNSPCETTLRYHGKGPWRNLTFTFQDTWVTPGWLNLSLHCSEVLRGYSGLKDLLASHFFAIYFLKW